MATRSTISILNMDNTVDKIYCHSDGYLEGNGCILYKYYRDSQSLREMIELGDMSYLDIDLKSCAFYHRDRGEDLNISKYSSYEDFVNSGSFEEYDYIFQEKDQTWYLINQQTKKLEILSDLLLNHENVSAEIKDMINAERLYDKINKELPNKPMTTNHKKI